MTIQNHQNWQHDEDDERHKTMLLQWPKGKSGLDVPAHDQNAHQDRHKSLQGERRAESEHACGHERLAPETLVYDSERFPQPLGGHGQLRCLYRNYNDGDLATL